MARWTGMHLLEFLGDGRKLTSVQRATEEMGGLATRALAARIHRTVSGPPPDLIVLPTTLVPGDTTAALAGAH